MAASRRLAVLAALVPVALAGSLSAQQSFRTRWGDPDLQGVWPSGYMFEVPFERPISFGTRTVLTDEEFAERVAAIRTQADADAAEFGASGSGVNPPSHWLERGQPSRQASLIVDPADGQLPPMTDDGARRARTWPSGNPPGGFASAADFTVYERCISRGVLGSSSRNGRQIAYGWAGLERPGGFRGELRVIANEPTAKPRTVSSASGRLLAPMDWSADDQSLLATEMAPGSNAVNLLWVMLKDGSRTLVKSLGPRASDRDAPVLSPDGKFIVYAVAGSAPDPAATIVESQLHLMAADGSGDTQLTVDGVNEGPTWAADGRHVLFVSNRGGSFGLWAVPVSSGRAAGAPQLVRSDTGRIFSVGATRAGSYYYVQNQSAGEGLDILEVKLDPSTGKPQSSPQLLSERSVGFNCCGQYSRDGTHVAFKRRRADNQNIRDLVVRALATGAERTYTAPTWTNTPYGFGPGSPKWLQSSAGLFVGDEPILGETRWLGKMDLEGRFTTLVQIPPYLGCVAALSPDDSTAYVLSRRNDAPKGPTTGVVAVDLTTGQQTRVFTAKDGLVLSVHPSPDGRRLALFVQAEEGGRNSSALATLLRDGSDYRELYVTKNPFGAVPDQVQWSHDGTSIFFPEGDRLMRISAAGGTPDDTGVRIPGQGVGHGFRMSPDGSRVTFGRGRALVRGQELWAIDNLMSRLTK